jgi:hypothetical protein
MFPKPRHVAGTHFQESFISSTKTPERFRNLSVTIRNCPSLLATYCTRNGLGICSLLLQVRVLALSKDLGTF